MTCVTLLARRQADDESSNKQKGISLHNWISYYIKTELYKKSDYEPPQVGDHQCKKQFIRWWKKKKLVPILCEYKVASENFEFGGRLDLLATDQNGRTILIDFKRSQYPVESSRFYWYVLYTHQLNDYRVLVEHLRGIHVDELRIVRMHPNLAEAEDVEMPIRPVEVARRTDEVKKLRCRFFGMTPVLVALVGTICWLLS